MTQTEAEDLLVAFLVQEHSRTEEDARSLVARFPKVVARGMLRVSASSYDLRPIAMVLEMFEMREMEA